MLTEADADLAILLIAYGGPASLDEVEAFVLDIRGGRPTPPELIEEIRRRYAAIGGRSPLPDITRQQAAALETYLRERHSCAARVYVGMRHSAPRLTDVVAHIAADNIRRLIALPMSPYYSSLGTGRSLAQLQEAIKECAWRPAVTPIASWHDHPGLITALAETAQAGLRHFAAHECPKVIFSAHSVPARLLEQGDPYDRQVRQTAALVAQRMGLAEGEWVFAYQSAGRSPEAWLGPDIQQVVSEQAQAGERQLLVVPIGFTCDQVEILYDIDITCRRLAERLGVHLERSPALNALPSFIAALADLVMAAVRQGSQQEEASPRPRGEA